MHKIGVEGRGGGGGGEKGRNLLKADVFWELTALPKF